MRNMNKLFLAFTDQKIKSCPGFRDLSERMESQRGKTHANSCFSKGEIQRSHQQRVESTVKVNFAHKEIVAKLLILA